MGSQTSLSGKGQVVIPKDVRDALALVPGQKFDVLMVGQDVVLRPKSARSGRSTQAILADLSTRFRYEGPPVSIADMNATVAANWIENARDSDG